MTHRNTKRGRFPATLVLTSVLLAAPAASLAGAAHAREIGVSPDVCRIDWRKGSWHVRQLVRCAANRWNVPGGARMALYIADRESNFEPRAYNSYSGASGVFQHLSRYWGGRADAFGFDGWSAFNARANIMVTMRMVHRIGSWSPWGH
ncbi:MAG TPA: hypothetical protein VJ979_00525 [Actinomycetota bacterium]|nr:hypothetical protein [Actinomycetota bacterium]